MDESAVGPDERRLAELVDEFETALRRGERPVVDEWCARHPSFADELRRRLPLCEQLARLHDGAPVPPSLPRRFGPYEVIDELGRGGMAWVLRARDERLNRELALKILPPDPLTGESGRERFRREARALARVGHPHVVAIHDVGEQGDFLYYAMDLMSGSLLDRLEEPDPGGGPPRDLKRILRWSLEATEGLAHLHEHGIVHRDVKPSNILVDVGDRACVSDTGLAWMEGEADLTRTGQAMGTTRFAPPEQLRGETATARSDVHGMGATIGYLLTGNTLSSRRAQAWPDWMTSGLQAVLRRALAEAPEDRYADARALHRALARIVARGVVRRVRPRSLFLSGVAISLAVLGSWAVLRNPTPSTVRPLDGPVGAIVLVCDREGYARSRYVDTLRHRGLDWDRLRARVEPGFPTDLLLGGRRHEVAVERGTTEVRLSLAREGRVVAETRFETRTPESFRRQVSPFDVDGDGHLDLVLASPDELAFVVWGVPALLDLTDGWTRQLPARFHQGSIVVEDWDSDGAAEVLLADTGEDPSTLVPSAPSLHEIDLATGRGERSWRLTPDEISNSTPRFERDEQGRVLGIYIDTEPPSNFGGGHLHRVRPGRRPRLETLRLPAASTGRLTWPLFDDVDADGVNEVLVARFDGSLHCIEQDAPNPVLWSFRLEEKVRDRISSYPVLSQQDDDPEDELCLVNREVFLCLDTQPGLEPDERMVWRKELRPRQFVSTRPTDLGDLTGDGLSEFAFGAGSFAVTVVSGEDGGRVIAQLHPPPETFQGLHGEIPPTLIPRALAFPGDHSRQRRVVTVTGSGWVVCWLVAADGAHDVEWTFRTAASFGQSEDVAGGSSVTSSPQLLQLSDGRELPRPALLVLSGHLYLLELAPDIGSPPSLTWSSWLPGRTQHASWVGTREGTPAAHQVGDQAWVVVGHDSGRVHALRIVPWDRPVQLPARPSR
ncbi:MAG: protein kinase [Acidobacteriota bacterium]